MKAELALKKHLVDKFMQDKATRGGLLKPPQAWGHLRQGAGGEVAAAACPVLVLLHSEGPKKGGCLVPVLSGPH